MNPDSPWRFVAFAAGAVVVAAVIFYVLSLLIGPHFDVGRVWIERWIVRATCRNYELEGVVHDRAGTPVAFAVIDAAYLDQHMKTRAGPDGRFKIKSQEPICDRSSDVALTVTASPYRPAHEVLKFDRKTVDVELRDAPP